MSERVVSSGLSADVVELLLKQGMTLAAIAAATGTSKSFISRVRSRARSLTIDHLVALEAALGQPLPLLLLKATTLESIRPDLRPLYKASLRAVSGEGAARKTTRRRASAA